MYACRSIRCHFRVLVLLWWNFSLLLLFQKITASLGQFVVNFWALSIWERNFDFILVLPADDVSQPNLVLHPQEVRMAGTLRTDLRTDFSTAYLWDFRSSDQQRDDNIGVGEEWHLSSSSEHSGGVGEKLPEIVPLGQRMSGQTEVLFRQMRSSLRRTGGYFLLIFCCIFPIEVVELL